MDEREVLRGRIRDLWHRTQEGEYLNHTGFLPLDLQSYAHRLIREDKIPERSGSGPFCMFSGGFPEADRKMLFFVPSYMKEEDVEEELAKGEGAFTCVKIAAVRSGFSSPPDHRDYLGSLMNLGITREQIYKAIGLLKKYNVPVKLNILIGTSPLETREKLRDTIRRARQLKVDQIMFNIVSPFPGTEFYKLARQNGWITTGDYVPTDVQRSSIVSYPNLSAREMERILFYANLRYFLSPSFVFSQLRRFHSSGEFFSALRALKIKLFG